MLDNIPILSLITFSPLLGVLVLLFIPKHKGGLMKTIAIITTLIPLLLAGWLYADYDRSTPETMQYTEEAEWISAPLLQEYDTLNSLTDFSLKLTYKMGADGL